MGMILLKIIKKIKIIKRIINNKVSNYHEKSKIVELMFTYFKNYFIIILKSTIDN
jgi:hypothetical protein